MDEQDEAARLQALRGYGLLDTPNEPAFDAIVREAQRALGAPIVLISLIDADRQWFKAKVGLDVAETPRCISFCTHALRGPTVFVVPDATADPRFSDNPLVTGAPHIRFYAGAPLTTPSGRRIGTLCVIDTRPRRDFSEMDAQKLLALADRTIAAIEARARARSSAAA